MYSMTGYGKGEFHGNGLEAVVEVKSVNNRYLDVAVKSPRILLGMEDTVRAAVRDRLTRGHVDVFISFSDKREKPRVFTVDMQTVRAYVRAGEKISGAFPSLGKDLTVSQLLRFPDVLRMEETTGADSELQEAVLQALGEALAALEKMRLSEGERLKEDLFAHMRTIASLRDRIEARAPLIAEEYRKKLAERVEEFVGGKADETRILTEVAVFADKCSIDEELTRLKSHIAEFYAISKSDRVGRKLDFLIQEFNRECNTICSKSNDGEITNCALEMKNEIEKVREQVQNLE